MAGVQRWANEQPPGVLAAEMLEAPSPGELAAACARLAAALPPGLGPGPRPGVGAFSELVRADAAALAGTLQRLCPTVPWLTLQLEAIGGNACTRWHQDNYAARLCLTYAGPSTWLVSDASVSFEQFRATRGMPFALADPLIVPSYDSIQMPPENAIVLMKGNMWPGISGGLGLTHKSPNVRVSNQGAPVNQRLMLKVDI